MNVKPIGELYEVSDSGKVFSVGSNWRGYGRRELQQTLNSYGYPSVRLTINGKRKRIVVHKLVAIAFIGPNPCGAMQIRHIDGDKTNNHVSNLAWGTARENADDRNCHGKTSQGEAHSIAIKSAMTPEVRDKISKAKKGKTWSKKRRSAK